MKAVGRIAITGTLGYDLSFIRFGFHRDLPATIRFLTMIRQLRFGEVYANTQTTVDNGLTAGEFDINDKGQEQEYGCSLSRSSAGHQQRGAQPGIPAQQKSLEAYQHYRNDASWLVPGELSSTTRGGITLQASAKGGVLRLAPESSYSPHGFGPSSPIIPTQGPWPFATRRPPF